MKEISQKFRAIAIPEYREAIRPDLRAETLHRKREQLLQRVQVEIIPEILLRKDPAVAKVLNCRSFCLIELYADQAVIKLNGD